MRSLFALVVVLSGTSFACSLTDGEPDCPIHTFSSPRTIELNTEYDSCIEWSDEGGSRHVYEFFTGPVSERYVIRVTNTNKPMWWLLFPSPIAEGDVAGCSNNDTPWEAVCVTREVLEPSESYYLLLQDNGELLDDTRATFTVFVAPE